jgi:hypothetical protein
VALQSDIGNATLNDLLLLRQEQPVLWPLVSPALDADYPIPFYIPVPGRMPLAVPMDLESETWGQSIDAIAAIESMEHDQLTGRLRLLAIYLQPGLDGSGYDSDRVEDAEYIIRHIKATDALAVSNYLITEVTRIANQVSEAMQTVPYTNEEEKAGVRELEQFGVFATVDGLTKGDSLKIDEWMRKPWAFVNAKLLLENKRAYIQHRLNKLLTPKQKAV